MSKINLRKLALNSALALCLPLAAVSGHAQSGLYVGASLGNASVGYSDTDTNIDIKDDDIGYKLYTGFKFTFAAIEGGYVNFGEMQSGDDVAKVSGLNAFGKVSLGLGPVSLFGKLGGFVWDSNLRTASGTYKESGFDPAAGVGAMFNLGSLGLRAEYEYYNISEFDKVSMFSLGATYWIF